MRKWLDGSVYDIVVATAADCKRMKRLVCEGELTAEQAAAFVRRISAVEYALIAVCEGERAAVRDALLTDIAERRGFERSVSRKYYPARSTFMRRKERAVRLMAEMLGLLRDGGE